MTSLRWRLLLAVGLVLAVVVAALGIFSMGVARLEFLRFLESEEESAGDRQLDLRKIRRELEQHYRHSGWQAVDGLLADLAGDANVLVLMDAAGTLRGLGSPTAAEIDVELRSPEAVEIELRQTAGDEIVAIDRLAFRGPATVLEDEVGRKVGSFFLVPLKRPAGPRRFLGSVRRWLWIGVFAAVAVALVMTAVLARRIIGPIEELTAVVRRMETGDLEQRLEVRSRDEIGELARAFNSMAAALARLEELRRNMVGDIAHELRTPLTGMRGQLEAIQDGLLEPDAAVIASLHEEVLLLGRLVHDLQELALAEAGQLRLEIRDVDLGSEIRRAVAAVTALADGFGVLVDDDAEAPRVRADPERLGQILRNLLQNAVTHTSAGGEIVVRARHLAGESEVAVWNRGEGIAPEHLPFVFERFYRTDPSRHHTTGGAGLGLAIVRQLVEAQGGRVWAESRHGEDCTFYFTLPQSNAPGSGTGRSQ